MRGLKQALIFFSIAFTIPFAKGQSLLIDLKKGIAPEPTDKSQFWLYPLETRLQGVPSDLDTVAYWVFPFLSQRFLYEQYNYGRIYESFNSIAISKESIEKAKIYYSNPSNSIDIKYKMYGISGFKNKKKVIIVDSNNNGDLSDETIIEIDTTSLTLYEKLEFYTQTPLFVVHYEILTKEGKILKREKIVKIQPFVKLINPYNQALEDLKFGLVTQEQFSGTIDVNGKKYNFLIDGWTEDDDISSMLAIFEYGQYQKTLRYGAIGETVKLGNTLIRLDSINVEKETLFASILGNFNPEAVGNQEGMKAPRVSVKDLNGNSFDTQNLSEKYIFMIYWGTWCGPCKADHPELKLLYDTYKSQNIQFLGFAVDNSEDGVKKYLRKEGMEWPNVFVNMNAKKESSSIIEDYHIHSYPTYFLIAPGGKILSKTGDLNSIKNKLQQNIKQ